MTKTVFFFFNLILHIGGNIIIQSNFGAKRFAVMISHTITSVQVPELALLLKKRMNE